MKILNKVGTLSNINISQFLKLAIKKGSVHGKVEENLYDYYWKHIGNNVCYISSFCA